MYIFFGAPLKSVNMLIKIQDINISKRLQYSHLLAVHHHLLLIPELGHCRPLVGAVPVEAQEIPVVGLRGQHVPGEVVAE